MIDTVAIVISSFLVIFIAIRATILDARNRAEAKQAEHRSRLAGDR